MIINSHLTMHLWRARIAWCYINLSWLIVWWFSNYQTFKSWTQCVLKVEFWYHTVKAWTASVQSHSQHTPVWHFLCCSEWKTVIIIINIHKYSVELDRCQSWPILLIPILLASSDTDTEYRYWYQDVMWRQKWLHETKHWSLINCACGSKMDIGLRCTSF